MEHFKFFHYYIIPLIAAAVWWGMLIAMLVCWLAQGHPMYPFMGSGDQKLVYISDIGATNLQPLFIACAGFQAIFFVGTFLAEFILRKQRKLQPYVSSKQAIWQWVSIVSSVIGQIGIICVAVFNLVHHHNTHYLMVVVFIVFCAIAIVADIINTFIFGNFPQRLSPDHEKVIFGSHKWANLYMVSFFLKCFWLVTALVFVILFAAFMGENLEYYSAVFEWLISFWYGFILIMWLIDLYPSAVKHWKRKHAQKVAAKEFFEDESSFSLRMYV